MDLLMTDDNGAGQLTCHNELNDILSSFPPGIVHAVGYGSGVFVQQRREDRQKSDLKTNDKEEAEELPMIDLIFAVDDPVAWHTENARLYPHHYSFTCRTLGPKFIASVQRSSFGAKVYFNPLVESPSSFSWDEEEGKSRRMIKYGVVQTDDLLSDLREWDYLYLAGRMHKPTVTIGAEHEKITRAQNEFNLKYALASSLLLMEVGDDDKKGNNKTENEGPVICSLHDLFEQIAQLSYAGDPRMDIGGEDPAKVQKLVHSPGQIERFWNLYRDSLKALHSEGLVHVSCGAAASGFGGGDLDVGKTIMPQLSQSNASFQGTVEYNPYDISTRYALCSMLPPRLKEMPPLSNARLSKLQLAQSITDIVKPAARDQSIKGVLTAGVVRSIRYAGAKFAKGALRKLPFL